MFLLYWLMSPQLLWEKYCWDRSEGALGRYWMLGNCVPCLLWVWFVYPVKPFSWPIQLLFLMLFPTTWFGLQFFFELYKFQTDPKEDFLKIRNTSVVYGSIFVACIATAVSASMYVPR